MIWGRQEKISAKTAEVKAKGEYNDCQYYKDTLGRKSASYWARRKEKSIGYSKKMLSKGMNLEEIIEITRLSKEFV